MHSRSLAAILGAAVLAFTVSAATPAGADDYPTASAAQIHALGCDVGAAPGYGDRVVLMPDGRVLRWSFQRLVDETVADHFFWMVGNCPDVSRA